MSVGQLAPTSLLIWAARFDYCVYLDSCNTNLDQYGDYDFLLAVADQEAIVCRSWEELQSRKTESSWWFGALSYDLKNQLEPKLKSENPVGVSFPELLFFRPDIVIFRKKGSTKIEVQPSFALHLIPNLELPDLKVTLKSPLKSNFSREEYLETIKKIKGHIREGDCYEVNLSQQYSAQAEINHPELLWFQLKSISPTPFSAYAKFREIHLLCGSPERFLRLKKDKLLTQPIKGTAPRDLDPEVDALNADRLRQSIKEQAENVMIVDLSRNDLYRSSIVDGVSVPELFEVQSFSKVHHLVSTILASIRPDLHPLDAIANTFPPGSMTGAPKFRTCELIEQYEGHARGLYAGSLGYISPEGDFDLNVIIRSMIFDEATGQLLYQMGGAITWDSDPEAEYEETLFKARAIREVLQVEQ